MLVYTQEVPDYERLKELITLALQCNGYTVKINPTDNKGKLLFECQKDFKPPAGTVVLRAEKNFVNWHRLCKFFVDREDGYGKIYIPDELCDKLIDEHKLMLLAEEAMNARTTESQETHLQKEV